MLSRRFNISADEPVKRSARGYRGWGWPDPGGHSNPTVPRKIGFKAKEPEDGSIMDWMAKHLRPAPGDMTSRPTFPYPPAYRKSGYYDAKNNPGSLNWRTGGPHQSSYRFSGIPSGMVRPYGITVERKWLRDLIHRPYRTQHRPILLWNERPYPVFDVKTTKRLPVRPAVAYPTWNFRPYDEEKAIDLARKRAGLKKGRK